ncbi:hypothetical protein CPB85DRAFT_1346059 [Mucidula mucida]|nr:hypothetical protein CPB85DRAFT_1346059 [Mucidula mucida]
MSSYLLSVKSSRPQPAVSPPSTDDPETPVTPPALPDINIDKPTTSFAERDSDTVVRPEVQDQDAVVDNKMPRSMKSAVPVAAPVHTSVASASSIPLPAPLKAIGNPPAKPLPKLASDVAPTARPVIVTAVALSAASGNKVASTKKKRSGKLMVPLTTHSAKDWKAHVASKGKSVNVDEPAHHENNIDSGIEGSG